MANQRNVTAKWVPLTIVTLAGAWTIVHLILSIAGVTANDYWGVALFILFLLALILAFVQYGQERPALEAVPSTEQFSEPTISKFFLGSEYFEMR